MINSQPLHCINFLRWKPNTTSATHNIFLKEKNKAVKTSKTTHHAFVIKKNKKKKRKEEPFKTTPCKEHVFIR